MRSLRFLFVLALVLTVCLAGTAFGSGQTDTSAAGATTTVSKTPPKDFLAKYTPEITLTAWRMLNAAIKFEPGENIENNVYMKLYKEKLGINLKYSWVVPEEQFEQKLNISIASGDLPDIMWLRNKQLVDLTEAGSLYDLTDLYKTHTSAATQSIMQQDQAAFDSAKIGGRLMAMPKTAAVVDGLQILWVRTDWLKKLGLEMPTTMQELLKVAEAFTTRDPDGNGKNDTFGMALTKNFIKDNHAGATGFFAGYHGYIRKWIKTSSGSLAYGTIQPEVRTALLTLQDMYKRGLLDQEFGVKDRAKVMETISAGKVGITYGGMSSAGAFLKDNVLVDAKADWLPIQLVSIDGKPATPISKMPVEMYYAVNKKCKYPEAIMKFTEIPTKSYSRDQQTDEEYAKYGISPTGIPTFQYQIVYWEPALKNLTAHRNVLKAFATKDMSILNAEERGYFDKVTNWREKADRLFWENERTFGTPSSFDIIEKYVTGKNFLMNAFYGSSTPTMVDKLATLEAMEDEVFTKIIMGQSIDTFDKFVDDWKKLGGDQITKEVNDWAKRNK
jgi:putative aldouronate transport system substrate-binding protein